jgi:putative transposase
MPRMARVVVPNIPHHVTQRGNRRQTTFFSDDDYRLYRQLLGEQCARCAVQVWAYCLMPNHVHLLLLPAQSDSLCRSLAETHRRYTLNVNVRKDWRGYLWQGRFASYPLDERHLHAAVRYIELNPVRAGLCDHPADWPWSSARAHLLGRDDSLVAVAPMLSLIGNWSEYLSQHSSTEEQETLRRHVRTGRPLGSIEFIERLERLTGRHLRVAKPGRKPGTQGKRTKNSI